MTTLGNDHGFTILRPDQGDMLVIDRRNPALLTVIPDPTGKLGEMMRVCAARRRREEEKQS